MKPFLAEDIRVILDKLDEYVDDKGTFGIGPRPGAPGAPVDLMPGNKKPGDVSPDKTQPDAKQPDAKQPGAYDQNIDDILKKPAGLKKLVGSLNVPALMDFLMIPDQYRSSLRSAINTLRGETRILTDKQSAAMAVAFAQALHIFRSRLPTVTSHAVKPAVAEDLDAAKIKNYMARDKQQSPGTDVDHIKSMIAAVDKHGTPNEKKELGLNEQMPGAQPVTITAYNSGIEKLADVANKPERKREVFGVLAMGDHGQPILRFTEKNETQVYIADWNPQYGWVADYD